MAVTNGNGPVPMGLDPLMAHLTALDADASLAPDAALFDNVGLHLDDTLRAALLPSLLPRLIPLLQTTAAQHDPAPLTSLISSLLRPVPFTGVLELAPPGALDAALALGARPAVNLLGIELLRKAAASANDVRELATHPDLHGPLEALLKLMLYAPDADVGTAACDVLAALLDRDSTSRMRYTENFAFDQDAGDMLLPVREQFIIPRGSGALWAKLLTPPHPPPPDRPPPPGLTPPRLAPLFVLHLLPLLGLAPTTTPAWAGTQPSYALDRILRMLPDLAMLCLPALTRRFTTAPANPAVPVMSVLELCAEAVDPNDELLVRCFARVVERLVYLLQACMRHQDNIAWTESMDQVREVVRRACAKHPFVRATVLALPRRVWPEGQAMILAWVTAFGIV